MEPDSSKDTAEKSQAFDFPLTIRFKFKNDELRKVLDVKQNEEAFYVPLKQAPEFVHADPELGLLASMEFQVPNSMLYALALMTLAGFALDGMTRDPGWRFQSIGRRLERLQFLCAALEQAIRGPRDANLEWLLELADSTITYRSRYLARPEWLPVLDLLVCDPSNPRSVAFQVFGIRDYLNRLAETFGACGADLLAPSTAALRDLDPQDDLQPQSPRLARLLVEIRAATHDLSDLLDLKFFSHAGGINRQTFAT